MAKTVHFKNCFGVFQGGGCKALAFVGAYREAMERGVFFSSVAGTSAGAIIAALIAAGASSEYLEKAISETDFETFRSPPDKAIASNSAGAVSAVLGVGTRTSRLISTFMKRLGIYSSDKIESWLEGHLRALIQPSADVAIKFKDLKIPLSVIATDLDEAAPVVWSTNATPDESVSYAVRCSCTIPIYFQAVNKRFVDGGIVSNLPSFVYGGDFSGAYERLLCFTFGSSSKKDGSPVDSKKNNSNSRVDEYLSSLIAAAIDGATVIQGRLQRDLHVVEIRDLPLGTLDFDKVNPDSVKEMYSAGAKSAKKFFDDEIPNLKVANARILLRTEAEALNQIVREDIDSKDSIVVLLNNVRYVYNLFPTFLYWATQNAKITFLVVPVFDEDSKESRHELFRRMILKSMGASILEVSSLPFEGIIFKRDSEATAGIVFAENRSDTKSACFGVKYDKAYDGAALNALISQVEMMFPADHVATPISAQRINFQKGGVEALFEKLRSVDQYKSKNIRFSHEEVNIENIRFLTRYVKSYKYGQIKRMFDIYSRNDLEFFGGLQVCYAGGPSEVLMPITPPVAEEYGGVFYLLEGNSRLTYLIKELKLRAVKLIVVRGVEAALASTGKFGPSELVISDEKRIGASRYEEFSYENFRNIEEAIRPPNLYVPKT